MHSSTVLATRWIGMCGYTAVPEDRRSLLVEISCEKTNRQKPCPTTAVGVGSKRQRKRLINFTYNKYYKNKNWLQFLFIVKAAVLKQQISKFYPQIQRTEASDHIYFSQRPFINVKAIFCA